MTRFFILIILLTSYSNFTLGYCEGKKLNLDKETTTIEEVESRERKNLKIYINWAKNNVNFINKINEESFLYKDSWKSFKNTIKKDDFLQVNTHVDNLGNYLVLLCHYSQNDLINEYKIGSYVTSD